MLAALAYAAVVFVVRAQCPSAEYNGKIIAAVKVEGVQRISPKTVRTLIRTLGRDLTSLRKAGRFENRAAKPSRRMAA